MKRKSIGMVLKVLLAAVWMLSCNESDPSAQADKAEGSTGGIQLALVAGSASGSMYRLRDGVFDIVGMNTGSVVTVSSEDNLDDETIEVSLAPDTYSVFLNDGWRLEQINPVNDEELEVQLISDNPVYADVSSTSTTDVNFRFLVNGEPVVTDGTLSIGISVEEGADCADDYEPNNTLETAASVSLDPSIAAVACTNDADYYIFDPSVEAGENFIVEVRFSHAISDIDVVLFDADGMEVDYSGSVSDMERVGAVSDGRPYILYVFPYNSSAPPNTYTAGLVEIPTCEDAYEPNNSFEAASSVSFDPPIEASTCGTDNDYYTFEPPVEDGEYFVVDIAFFHAISDIDAALFDADGMEVSYSGSVSDMEQVGVVSDGRPYVLWVYPFDSTSQMNTYTVSFGEAVESDCCTTSIMPGCSDPEVETCVCDYDDWCCEYGFDEYCVEIAFAECNVQCTLSDGDCCEASEERGCGDTDIQDCICQIDSACCTDVYDEFCVTEAKAECGLECNTPPPDSDCCSVGANPGCTDSNVEACVCEIDPYCCAAPFDSNCVGIAADVCGATC
jgi:hypothetical protein